VAPTLKAKNGSPNTKLGVRLNLKYFYVFKTALSITTILLKILRLFQTHLRMSAPMRDQQENK
jgi:hypothetical protein